MAKISDIRSDVTTDSRGKETVEVIIVCDDGSIAIDSVPSGTSTGSFEAKTVDPKVAVENITNVIKPKILGQNPVNQLEIDRILLDLDGTQDKHNLGANAILGVSLAVARAGSEISKIPLYMHLNSLFERITRLKIEPAMPIPMMVMFEGGLHGNNNLCIQEFLVLASLDKGKKIWQDIRDELVNLGIEPKQGLEGGFMPQFDDDQKAIELMLKAIKKENYKIPEDVKIGLDIARNNCQLSMDDILKIFNDLPIYSLEDPIEENDWNNWTLLKQKLDNIGRDYLLIGDDLFTTNLERLNHGIEARAANGIIIKVNQIGTLTETMQVIAQAMRAGMTHILSHRSGETMDSFIADLSYATAAKFIKSGAPFAKERTVKYERLEEIAKENI